MSGSPEGPGGDEKFRKNNTGVEFKLGQMKLRIREI